MISFRMADNVDGRWHGFLGADDESGCSFQIELLDSTACLLSAGTSRRAFAIVVSTRFPMTCHSYYAKSTAFDGSKPQNDVMHMEMDWSVNFGTY
jgi:hypothetical protein